MSEGGVERPSSYSPFRPLPKYAQLVLEGLDTGDIVLFDRPCFKMGSFVGAAVCIAAKTVSGCPFDHVGVVVRDESGVNLLVEASFSGVAVRPLLERIRRSTASQICVRTLETNRTEEMRAEARSFVSAIAHLPYKEGTEGLLQMAVVSLRLHAGKERRRQLHAQAVGWSRTIARLEAALMGLPENNENANRLLRESLERATDKRDQTLKLLAYSANWPNTDVEDDTVDGDDRLAAHGSMPAPCARSPPSAVPRHDSSPLAPANNPPTTTSSSSSSSLLDPSDPRTPAASGREDRTNDYEKNGIFCSELVAALYQRLGLLDAPFPSSSDYVPADFAQSLVAGESASGPAAIGHDEMHHLQDGDGDSHGGRLAFLRGATLGPGHWIRGESQKRDTEPPYAEGQDRGSETEQWVRREAEEMVSRLVGVGGVTGRGQQSQHPSTMFAGHGRDARMTESEEADAGEREGRDGGHAEREEEATGPGNVLQHALPNVLRYVLPPDIGFWRVVDSEEVGAGAGGGYSARTSGPPPELKTRLHAFARATVHSGWKQAWARAQAGWTVPSMLTAVKPDFENAPWLIPPASVDRWRSSPLSEFGLGVGVSAAAASSCVAAGFFSRVGGTRTGVSWVGVTVAAAALGAVTAASGNWKRGTVGVAA